MAASETSFEPPSSATSSRCAEFEDILRLVCSYLELPQSESGPADDIRLYDRALEAADLYSRQADADLAEQRRLRFEAEADRERLLQAVAPFVAVAAKLAHVSDAAELHVCRGSGTDPTLALADAGAFRKLHKVVTGIARNKGS